MNGEGVINSESNGEGKRPCEEGNWCEGHNNEIGCRWYHGGMCVLICAPCERYEG